MLAELDAQVARVAEDASVRAVVLRGPAGGPFSSGADIGQWADMPPEVFARDWITHGNAVLRRFEALRCPKPARRHAIIRLVLGEIGLQGSVAGMGDDMREAMTLIAHNRVRLAEFVETVCPLARITEAMQAFINDRRISKIQIDMAPDPPDQKP